MIDKKWVVTVLVFITKTRWLSSDAYKCLKRKQLFLSNKLLLEYLNVNMRVFFLLKE